MGSVIGKESVEEPPYEILLDRKNAATPYEIRKYGVRFAATCTYDAASDTGSPFRTLAGYIGVFSKPQNEGGQSISMTAPVVMEKSEGTSIAMTAPVVMENAGAGGDSDGKKVMKFMLPVEYDSMDKIPKPTNPAVHIEEIPSQIGAVYRYSGAYEEEHNRKAALKLGHQLMADGVREMTENYMIEHYQFWGYNPPFCLPAFRRNEVWVQMTQEQVDNLSSAYKNGALKDSSVAVSVMRSPTKLAAGSCALLVGVFAVSFLAKSRGYTYRRV